MRTHTQASRIHDAFTDIHRGLTGLRGTHVRVDDIAEQKPLPARKPKVRGWPAMALRCLTNIETDSRGNRMVDACLTPGGTYQGTPFRRYRGGPLMLCVRNDAGQLSICRLSGFEPINPYRRPRFRWGA